jgi:putative flippase GtrA
LRKPRPALAVASRLSQHRSRGLRYLAIGGFNTVFGITSFVVLQETLGKHVGYLVVLVISWVLNVLEAFLTYRFLVFRVNGQFFLDLARFSSVYAASFGINLVLLPFGVEVLGLPVIVAQASVLAFVVLASYAAHSSFSFRRVPPSASSTAADPTSEADQPQRSAGSTAHMSGSPTGPSSRT